MDFRLPIESRNSPENLVSERFKCFKLSIDSGNSPEKLVEERAKNFRELLLQLHFGREPKSRLELNPRSRVCILGRQRMLFSSFPYK